MVVNTIEFCEISKYSKENGAEARGSSKNDIQYNWVVFWEYLAGMMVLYEIDKL